MQALLLIIHVLAAISIVALVLMQHGRGADVGASFGSGSSNTMFGSAGAVPFLMKLTVALTAVFFLTSISLNYLAAHRSQQSQSLSMPVMPAAPAKAAPQQKNTNDVGDFSFTPSSKK